MDLKEQERRFLSLARSIAKQALKLPPEKRQAFIRSEIAELRQMYEPVHRVKTSSPG